MFLRTSSASCRGFIRSTSAKISRSSLRQVHTATGQSSSSSTKNLWLFSGGLAAGLAIAYGFRSSKEAKPTLESASKNTSNTISTRPASTLEALEYASDEEVKAALEQIKKIVGPENVKTDPALIEDHSDSSWQTRHPKPNEVPKAVVLPSSTEQISQILKIANHYKIPVTAFSGGTSLEGHFTPVYGGLSLDVSNLNKIIAVHPEDLDVIVQPAVGWEELNDTLRDHGLMFGTDAGPGATIGGMVNTGASGINAYFYGPMRNNVVNLTVVLADGTIIKTKKRPRKSSAGYNLNELFVGSEGTLGIVTEVTLRLGSIPNARRVALVTFPKISDATQTVQDILKYGLSLDAMELMDSEQMKIINTSGTTERKWDEDHTLLLRFAGANEASIDSSIAKVKELAAKHDSLSFAFARSDEESTELWSARKNALWSVQGAFPDKVMWTTDVAVPISQLSQIFIDSKEYVKEAGIIASVVGHVGDGNFHLLIAYDPATQKKAAETVADKLVKRALELDGTCTGEHGVGAGKRSYLLEEVGPEAVATMRQIKAGLDPNSILNPGKIFQTSKLDISDHA